MTIRFSIRAGFGALCLAGAFLFGSPAPLRAVVRTVPDDHPNIQDAIDACSAGDEVRVAVGIYKGAGNKNLDFGGKDIRVVSQGGSGKTLIDCERDGRAFYLHSYETQSAVIEGFTIMGGSTERLSSAMGGGGILCNGASPTIKNCVIRSCYDGQTGGGVCLYTSNAVLIHCDLRGNVVGSAAGPSGFGGGLFLDENSNVSLEECLLVDNHAKVGSSGGGGVGGGIYCAGNLTVNNSKILGNTADSFGGALASVRTSAPMTVSLSVITGNHSRRGGGAIYAEAVPISLRQVTLAANRTEGHKNFGGGGILCLKGGSVDCQSTIVWANCSPEHPGNEAVVDASSTLSFVCSNADSALVRGAGTIRYSADHVFADPLFCEPDSCGAAPTEFGEYTIDLQSPCLETNSPCGSRIGALEQRCNISREAIRLPWGGK